MTVSQFSRRAEKTENESPAPSYWQTIHVPTLHHRVVKTNGVRLRNLTSISHEPNEPSKEGTSR